MFKVEFSGKQTSEVALERESSILSAAAKGEVDLTHRCGGHARCGTCLITVEAGTAHLTPVGPAEARILKVLKAGPDQRLGCQAWAQGDVACRID
jgi:ferredoxin